MSRSMGVAACALWLVIACSAQSVQPAAPALDLSLEKAIEMALSPQGNTTVQLAHESEQMAHSRYTDARAGLLPNLDGSVAEQNQIVNLRALGVRSVPNSGIVLPTEVGPFYTFDARMHLNQNVLNLSTIRRWQAAQQDVHAAKAETDGVSQRIAGAVAKIYADALRADADVDAAKANLTFAEALRDLAANRVSVGEGTDLELTRSKLSVARDQQRLLAAQTERTRAYLDLINVLNLNWNTGLRLTGTLGSPSAEVFTPEEAVAVALKSRADFRVQENRTESAKLSYSAAKYERMPSIVGYADYGVISGVQTHTIGAALRVPIFDGGRLDSDRAQTSSLIRQEQIRQTQLRNQVELEIRQSLATLASTEQQVQVAEQAVTLAEDELGRARRRYEAGIANSLEVSDAQTQLETARNDRVAALFNYTNARIDLAQAMGTIKQIRF